MPRRIQIAALLDLESDFGYHFAPSHDTPAKFTTTAVRVVTAIVLIPIVVGFVWWGSTGLIAGFAGLVTLLALVEFFALGEHVVFTAIASGQASARWP